MSNIILGEKSKEEEGYYENAVDTLSRLGKVKIGWFSTKYLPTNEKMRVNFYYVLKEYASTLMKCYEEQNWAAIADLPREENGTAYQLKIYHVDSKKHISLQIIEARTGSDGGYFNIVPPILYFEEEAEKRFADIEKLFEK